MDELTRFSRELIMELEKKFKTACCAKTAEAYLDCALLVKHKLKQKQQENSKQVNS
jgi:hypothetical protein